MQRTVATSTAEAEYMCVSDAAHEALWLRKLIAVLLHLDIDKVQPTEIMEDNRAAQKWCYNPLNHATSPVPYIIGDAVSSGPFQPRPWVGILVTGSRPWMGPIRPPKKTGP